MNPDNESFELSSIDKDIDNEDAEVSKKKEIKVKAISLANPVSPSLPDNSDNKEAPVTKTYSAPTVGFRNRAIYPIHIVFKEDDVLLMPGQSTNKLYNTQDVVSVQKMNLNSAISKGIVAVLH